MLSASCDAKQEQSPGIHFPSTITSTLPKERKSLYCLQLIEPAWGKHTKARCQCQQSVSQPAEDKPMVSSVQSLVFLCSKLFAKYQPTSLLTWLISCYIYSAGLLVGLVLLMKCLFQKAPFHHLVPVFGQGDVKSIGKEKQALTECLETLKWG